MNTPAPSHLAVVLACLCCCLAGCAFNTHGNRQDDRRLITQAKDLPPFVGKRVTLVGTARAAGVGGDPAVELRGGSVAVPAYEWPAGYADQPVAVTGTLFQRQLGVESRHYQLGEIQGAQRWSR